MMISLEDLSRIGAIVAGISGAVAGVMQFRNRMQDRERKTKLDAAMYLKDHGSALEMRQMGAKRVERAYFKDITDIDRDTGHESLRRLHIRLGSDDRAWRWMKGAGRHLIATGHVARVRKLHRRDHILASLTFMTFSLLAGASVMAGVYSVFLASNLDWSTLKATEGINTFNFILTTGALAFWSALASMHWSRHLNALSLYRRTKELGLTRRQVASRSRKQAPVELTLVEMEPPSLSPMKPHLIEVGGQHKRRRAGADDS